MALSQVLNSRKSGPYAAPPPLHIHILREKEKSQVIFWDFSKSSVVPKILKKNKVVIITDGQSVAKVTLFEELSSKVCVGRNYIMKGYKLQGTYPPYAILPTPHTAFYWTSPVSVTESLEQEAERLLDPPSTLTPLMSVDQVTGQSLLTFEGKVLEVFAIRRVKTGRYDVPMKQIRLQQDRAEVSICLWREAAIFPLEAGGHVRLTHMKRGSSVGGHFQSTNYTKIEVIIQAAEEVELNIIAVREGREKGDLELLLENFETLEVEAELWDSLGHSFEDGPLRIRAERTGKRVSKITVLNEM
ncbi:uncharacterized protein LOC144986980 [Oryzias latipes]